MKTLYYEYLHFILSVNNFERNLNSAMVLFGMHYIIVNCNWLKNSINLIIKLFYIFLLIYIDADINTYSLFF